MGRVLRNNTKNRSTMLCNISSRLIIFNGKISFIFLAQKSDFCNKLNWCSRILETSIFYYSFFYIEKKLSNATFCDSIKKLIHVYKDKIMTGQHVRKYAYNLVYYLRIRFTDKNLHALTAHYVIDREINRSTQKKKKQISSEKN